MKFSNVVNNGGQMTNTNLRNGGRVAGMGTLYDRYDEESGNPDYEKYGRVRFPLDHIEPEDLNGECIIVQKGRKKDG